MLLLPSAPARLNLSRRVWHNIVLLFISVLPYYIKLENIFRLNDKGYHRFVLESLSKEACRQAVGPQGVDKLRSGIGGRQIPLFRLHLRSWGNSSWVDIKRFKANADEVRCQNFHLASLDAGITHELHVFRKHRASAALTRSSGLAEVGLQALEPEAR